MGSKKINIIIFKVLVVPLIIGLFLLRFNAQTFHAHTLHFYYVLLSALVSGLLSFFAYLEYKKTRKSSVLMVTIGFIGVSIFYAFHGLLTPEYSIFAYQSTEQHIKLFVFYGDLSRLWLALMIFFTGSSLGHFVEKVGMRRFFLGVIVLCVGLAMFIGLNPELIPNIKEADGTDTHFAILLKTFTLVIIGMVIIRYYSSYKIKPNVSVLFLITGLLFVFQAVIIFMISTPWGLVWWLAHNLFLMSYIVIGAGLIYNRRKKQTLEYFDIMSEVQDVINKLDSSNKKLTEIVNIDALTSAYSRKYIYEFVQNQLAENPNEPFALLFVDVNDFKIINDEHGHLTGDYILEIMSKRLKTTIKESDIVARVGGDEFLIYIHQVSETQTHKIIARLNAALKEPVIIDNKTFMVSASIGQAHYPQDAKTVDELITISDKNMYLQKAQ